MTSKGTLVLTGANGGIATGFLSQFLKTPHASQYKGYYTVRDPSSASTLHSTLASPTAPAHDYEIATLDMSTLASTRAGAAEINKRVASGSLPPIRALILNAGVQDSTLNFTSDGLERTFAINYLHQFLLVLLTLQSMDRDRGRIVVIGSTSIFTDWWPNAPNYRNEGDKVLFTEVEEVARGRRKVEEGREFEAGQRRYAASKVFMVMFMFSLHHRLKTAPSLSKISILTLDPGWVTTDIGRNNPFLPRALMRTFQFLAPLFHLFSPNHFVRSAAKTGDDLVRVCFEDSFGTSPGGLYVDGAVVGAGMNEEARDEGKQRRLWEGSLGLAGVEEGDTVLEDWR